MNNYDPIIIHKRKGTSQDPFVSISESFVIQNNVAELSEIPNMSDRVSVSGYSEKSSSVNLSSTQFYVDYRNGLVFFNPSENGKTLTFSYKGTGVSYFPATRIWTKENSGTVQETLQNIIDTILTAIGNGLPHIDDSATSTTSVWSSSKIQSLLTGKANAVHTHTISDVTNLQSSLDGKASAFHTHAISDVSNLQVTLNNKANVTHIHAISDITNLQTTLDGKATAIHTHLISDITNLQTTLDSKAGTGVVTTSVNGLMTASDKSKLDGIAVGANNYVHPSGDGNLHVPANGTTNSGKFLKATGTAGVYQWVNITASDITQDSNNRFITDSERTLWNSGGNIQVATTSANGLMSSADKTKLDGIASGANNYVHPATHPATMIVEDETHRFVTDAEKATWNSGGGSGSGGVVTASSLPTASSGVRGSLYLITGSTAASEVFTLTVTSGATTASNVTVTLDGIAYTVAVASTDTATQVATKIRNASYDGWSTSGTGTSVIFTSSIAVSRKDSTYSAGTTGATATINTTTQGANGTPDILYTCIRLANGTYDWKPLY